MEEPSQQQLQEYESQLADVQELLKASTDDASLLTLQSDLQELINITRQTLNAAAGEEMTPSHQEETSTVAVAKAPPTDLAPQNVVESTSDTQEVDTQPATAEEPPKKKLKKMKEFEVPKHLIPLDTDSEAEKNRKRRAIKALKSKWREQKKGVEAEKKKNSWQSFQKKKKIKDKSIFSTTTDVDAKVGVVAASGRQLAESGQRKRHK